ncbi:hypothetical protein HMPREF0208_01743 [Citrobacter koseri]|nr:hypothetical protein HMPREF0208_01743 [Citrobacter koseri]
MYRVFLFVLLTEKFGLPFSAGFPLKRGNIILSVCRGCLRFIRHRLFVFVVHMHVSFYKNIKLFL